MKTLAIKAHMLMMQKKMEWQSPATGVPRQSSTASSWP